MNEETYRLEMLDITKILGLDEHTTFDEVKEYATNLQEKNKNALALTNRTIEIIKQQPSENDEWILERLNGIKYCLKNKKNT